MTHTFSLHETYVWITGFNYGDGRMHDFLINLITLETTLYNTPVNDFFWSPDSRFGWIDGLDSSNAYMLSVASKKLVPFSTNPSYAIASWRPKDHILAYMAESDQTLAILNAQDMTVHGWKLPFPVGNFLWSPNGEHMVFTSTDGSLWQANYPKFDNFEQLTPPLPKVSQVNWLPDRNSIAFVNDKDIHVVDTVK